MSDDDAAAAEALAQVKTTLAGINPAALEKLVDKTPKERTFMVEGRTELERRIIAEEMLKNEKK